MSPFRLSVELYLRVKFKHTLRYKKRLYACGIKSFFGMRKSGNQSFSISRLSLLSALLIFVRFVGA